MVESSRACPSPFAAAQHTDLNSQSGTTERETGHTLMLLRPSEVIRVLIKLNLYHEQTRNMCFCVSAGVTELGSTPGLPPLGTNTRLLVMRELLLEPILLNSTQVKEQHQRGSHFNLTGGNKAKQSSGRTLNLQRTLERADHHYYYERESARQLLLST